MKKELTSLVKGKDEEQKDGKIANTAIGKTFKNIDVVLGQTSFVKTIHFQRSGEQHSETSLQRAIEKSFEPAARSQTPPPTPSKRLPSTPVTPRS